MNIAAAYASRFYRQFRNEVLVQPAKMAVVVFCAVLLVLPLLTQDSYTLRVLILASIFAIFASSWDLLSGFTGQMNFGHALFFGVAAYTSALVNIHTGLPPALTIPIGAMAAVVAGLIVGIPCLRLRGPYLALATLAFPLILAGIVFAVPGITGGELGLSGISPLAGSRVISYYIAVCLLLVLGFTMWKITTSHTGILFHAIREDEVTARASGINTTRYKLMAFCLSGLFAGIAGGLYVHFIRIAGPSTLELLLSFQAIIWAVFGGVATIYGPVVGVFILFPATEFLRVAPELRMLIFAIMVLLVLLFMPEGITIWLRDKVEKECPRCKLRNIALRRTCRVCQTALDQV
ncbi:MAG: branched-chain amino acid ABC transporter permease [Dehalococcoidia bacterium]|nr:branched-chain amino acid ABC transporter permease [Dehalococcoidia bacterium]